MKQSLKEIKEALEKKKEKLKDKYKEVYERERKLRTKCLIRLGLDCLEHMEDEDFKSMLDSSKNLDTKELKDIALEERIRARRRLGFECKESPLSKEPLPPPVARKKGRPKKENPSKNASEIVRIEL